MQIVNTLLKQCFACLNRMEIFINDNFWWNDFSLQVAVCVNEVIYCKHWSHFIRLENKTKQSKSKWKPYFRTIIIEFLNPLFWKNKILLFTFLRKDRYGLSKVGYGLNFTDIKKWFLHTNKCFLIPNLFYFIF